MQYHMHVEEYACRRMHEHMHEHMHKEHMHDHSCNAHDDCSLTTRHRHADDATITVTLSVGDAADAQ